MTFGLTFKGNLQRFLAESAEIYETVLFKKKYSDQNRDCFTNQGVIQLYPNFTLGKKVNLSTGEHKISA